MPGLLSVLNNATNDIWNDPSAWTVYSGGGGSSIISNTNAGIPVSEEKALTLSTWYAALRNVSEDIAKLPFHLYEYTAANSKQQVFDHPVSTLLSTRPNFYQDPITFREQMTHWLVGWGNAYARIHRDGRMNPMELEPIHPGRVVPQWNEDGTRVIYKVAMYERRNGRTTYLEPIEIDQDNMLHLRGLGSDPLVGYSIIRMAAESLALSLAVDTFAAASFKNRGAVGAILKHPAVMEESAYKRFKESFDASYRGAKNAGGYLILEDGMTYEAMSLPPEDMQFIQTRTLQIEDTLRWLRMPPSKVGHLNKANYNTLEMQNQEYVTDTMLGLAVRWEQQIKRKLFRADENKYTVKHNFKGMLRGDQKAQAEFVTKMWNCGAYSTNDIREYMDDNPIGPEGDHRFVPSNYMPLKPEMVTPQEAKATREAARPTTPPVAPKATLSLQQAHAVIWPAFDRVQKRVEKHIPVLQKRHGEDLDAMTAALGEFNAEMRELVRDGLSAIWQSFDGDMNYLHAALGGNQPIVFEETAQALASALVERKAA